MTKAFGYAPKKECPELMYSGTDSHFCLAEVEAVITYNDHVVAVLAGCNIKIPQEGALDFMRRWYEVKEWQYSQ